MKTVVRLVLAAMLALSAAPAPAAEGHPHAAPPPSGPPPAAKDRCAEHGVARSLCVRCNPKLAPVYKAKGDWCPEHARPESQCVLCHPELAKRGVK